MNSLDDPVVREACWKFVDYLLEKGKTWDDVGEIIMDGKFPFFPFLSRDGAARNMIYVGNPAKELKGEKGCVSS